jgi:thiol-disulfide isomerase/thioredoxin
MLRHKFLLFIVLFIAFTTFISCGKQSKQAPVTQQNQKAEVVTIPDFDMTDMNGKQLSILNEVKNGKITVIDFWASWCGPCMAEAPNMVKLYSDYHDKGLAIVGISLDKDVEAWHQAVENKHMNWTQLSDLQGWDNAAARLFGINSIPYTIIVDAKGQILATNLRGQELQDFVAKKLK